MKSYGLLILSLASFAALFLSSARATKYAYYPNPVCLGPPRSFYEWDTIIPNNTATPCSVISYNGQAVDMYVSSSENCTDGQRYTAFRYMGPLCNSRALPFVTGVPGSCESFSDSGTSSYYSCDDELPVTPYVFLEFEACYPPAAPIEAPTEALNPPVSTKRSLDSRYAVFNNSVAGTCQPYWRSDGESSNEQGLVDWVMMDAVCDSSFTGNLTINFYNTSDCEFFSRSETYVVSSDPCDNFQVLGQGVKLKCVGTAPTAPTAAPSVPSSPSAIETPTSASVSFLGISIAFVIAILAVFVQ